MIRRHSTDTALGKVQDTALSSGRTLPSEKAEKEIASLDSVVKVFDEFALRCELLDKRLKTSILLPLPLWHRYYGVKDAIAGDAKQLRRDNGIPVSPFSFLGGATTDDVKRAFNDIDDVARENMVGYEADVYFPVGYGLCAINTLLSMRPRHAIQAAQMLAIRKEAEKYVLDVFQKRGSAWVPENIASIIGGAFFPKDSIPRRLKDCVAGIAS